MWANTKAIPDLGIARPHEPAPIGLAIRTVGSACPLKTRATARVQMAAPSPGRRGSPNSSYPITLPAKTASAEARAPSSSTAAQSHAAAGSAPRTGRARTHSTSAARRRRRTRTADVATSALVPSPAPPSGTTGRDHPKIWKRHHEPLPDWPRARIERLRSVTDSDFTERPARAARLRGVHISPLPQVSSAASSMHGS